MVNGITKGAVMTQIIQIIQNVWAVLMRAVGLALQIDAAGAVEILVFISKTHGISPSCKVKCERINTPPLRTKQKSGGSRRHRSGDSSSRRFFSMIYFP
jgi:hypothetical protein